MIAARIARVIATNFVEWVGISDGRANKLHVRLVYGCASCMFIFATGAMGAQCRNGDPEGYYVGSATSAQVGKLDVSLNLLCDKTAYTGTLSTPVGLYTITSGSFSRNLLKLSLLLNGNPITLEGMVTGSSFNGTFSSADDKGPLELHRTGNAIPPTNQAGLTPQQWHEDLSFFSAHLTKLHPDAFANTPKPQFDAAVSELDAKIDQLNSDEIFVGLDHLANLIGDGHTYVKLPADDANLPLDIGRFGDDSRIDMVAPGYEQALGTRVIAIQDTPLSHARELAATLTPVAETVALRDLRVDSFLSIGMMLHGLGITSSRSSTRYLLGTDDGKQITVDFKALAPGEKPKWVHAASPLPLAEQPVDGSAACTLLKSARTLYCNVRMILQLKEPSQQMLDLLDREQPEKLVIDLRENGGGDYNLGLKYLIHPIMKNKSINRKGHLYVLIGPDTFSAAMSNAAQFRTMTQATLVGEQIGERPNSFQEPREFTLPNSRLIVRYSTRFYTFTSGSDNVIAPDKEITTNWEDFKTGHDAALDWILRQK